MNIFTYTKKEIVTVSVLCSLIGSLPAILIVFFGITSLWVMIFPLAMILWAIYMVNGLKKI